ncbi:MAG: hypothetical protein NZ519_02465 [Bacteroidia bacterium]|nr:hypothetical protein [Bacteroidia bacterium]
MPLGSTKRSEVPKRSAVRNAPTLASARGTPKKITKNKLFFRPDVTLGVP